MNVKQLRDFLATLPDDMEVLNGRYSDYCIVKPDEVYVIKAVPKAEWVMRSHPTMSAENKAAEREYLYIEGN
jgi:hypothetical protein